MLELSPLVLRRVLDPFPVPLRTLDAIHLSSIDYLRSQQLKVQLATYDKSMGLAARALKIPLERL
jgi:hypothetical protein